MRGVAAQRDEMANDAVDLTKGATVEADPQKVLARSWGLAVRLGGRHVLHRARH